jgi:hypothetical protein
MSEAREVDNKELRDLAGFALIGTDNAKLEKKLGLVETNRSHRPFSHQLTKEGWRVVRQLHAIEPPKQGGSASRTILTLLGNIHRSLEQLRTADGVKLSPEDFFKHKSATTDEAISDMFPGASPEARIRVAYAELTARPGDWVGLADLRDHLTNLDRAEVDDALFALLDQDGVRIIPVANSKALKPRDHAAALNIGGEDNHALSIDRP